MFTIGLGIFVVASLIALFIASAPRQSPSSNSIYPVPSQHMWLLCLRRHVVGGPLSNPAVALRCRLPFIQARRCTPETETNSSPAPEQQTPSPMSSLIPDLVQILALRFPILVLSRSGPYPNLWPSFPCVLDIVSSSSTMHSCVRIPPWSSILRIPAPRYSQLPTRPLLCPSSWSPLSFSAFCSFFRLQAPPAPIPAPPTRSSSRDILRRPTQAAFSGPSISPSSFS